MTGAAVASIRLEIVAPVPATRWCFLAVTGADGLTGTGEATLQAAEADVLDRAGATLPAFLGAPAEPAAVARLRPADLPQAAILSALSQAFHDLAAHRTGLPLARVLGAPAGATVPLYANINRRTRDRSPAGFAASAQAAREAGFDALKIAPFDEVTAAARAEGREGEAMGPGLARAAAVRAALGREAALMVDCHWRFTPQGAARAIDALAGLGLHWVECPLPEDGDAIPAIARLRRQANGRGMRLAGLETAVGVEGFAPFLDAGAYDVVMPDVKYIGSIEAMAALARRLAGTATTLSPHNPSGPVSHAASLHVAAALAVVDRLEMQFDETGVFDRLVADALPAPRAGRATLPAGPGLGVALDRGVVAAHRVLRREFRP